MATSSSDERKADLRELLQLKKQHADAVESLLAELEVASTRKDELESVIQVEDCEVQHLRAAVERAQRNRTQASGPTASGQTATCNPSNDRAPSSFSLVGAILTSLIEFDEVRSEKRSRT